MFSFGIAGGLEGERADRCELLVQKFRCEFILSAQRRSYFFQVAIKL
jgi:hypothetical protein